MIEMDAQMARLKAPKVTQKKLKEADRARLVNWLIVCQIQFKL